MFSKDIIYLTIFGKYKTPVNSLFPYFISIAVYSVLHFQNHTTFIEALITRIYTCTIILKLLKGVAMKISEMKKLLKKNGCFYVRELNGHEDWYSPITKSIFLYQDTIRRNLEQESKTQSKNRQELSKHPERNYHEK